jgi:hypothetical protein
MMVAQVAVQVPTPLPPPGVDPNFLISQLIPLVGVIGGMVIGALMLRWLFRSPMAEAMAERIRARTRRDHGGTATGEIEGDRVAQLEHEVTSLQSQLSELAERVDFAERLLAERRETKLSAGR